MINKETFLQDFLAILNRSESLEILEEMFPWYYRYIVVALTGSNL